MTYLKHDEPLNTDKEPKFYRVKMPIHGDLKRWLQKWWGREAFFADKQTTLGTLLKLAVSYGEPPDEAENKTIEAMDDFLYIHIPHHSFLSNRQILLINDTLRHWMVDQLVAVSCAKRDNLESPSVAVIQYYSAEFNLQSYTSVALDKASQRLREQRNLPRFVMRKR